MLGSEFIVAALVDGLALCDPSDVGDEIVEKFGGYVDACKELVCFDSLIGGVEFFHDRCVE